MILLACKSTKSVIYSYPLGVYEVIVIVSVFILFITPLIVISNTSSSISSERRGLAFCHLLVSNKPVQKLGMLFEVKQSWIDALIEGTEESFGSIESYLKDEIRLDLEALIQIYCR